MPDTQTSVVRYRSTRLSFRRSVINQLAPNEAFIIDIVPVTGLPLSVTMTRTQFEREFASILHTRSWQVHGSYHFPQFPQRALPFVSGDQSGSPHSLVTLGNGSSSGVEGRRDLPGSAAQVGSVNYSTTVGAGPATNLTALTTSDLLTLWSAMMRELRARGAIRSSNNPVGDVAESRVTLHLGLRLAGNSTTAYDAVHPTTGERFQIKGRRLTPENRSRQLSAIRGLEAKGFDHLVAVIFDEDFNLIEMWQIPHHVVVRHATYRQRVNAHILFAQGAVLTHPDTHRLI